MRTGWLAVTLATLAAWGQTANITVFPRDNSGKPVPRFANGYTVFYDRQALTVTWFAPGGQQAGPVELKLPGAGQLVIADVTASPNGVVAVAANAFDAEHNRGASVLFWLNPAGHVERIVHTAPFAPRRLAFSPDTSLWVLGKVLASPGQPTPHHDMLRRFDPEGRLVTSALPRTAFAAAAHPADDAVLTTSANLLGLYLPVTQEYVELDAAGTLLARIKIAQAWPPSAHIAALGLTPAGTLYFGGFDRTSAGPFAFALERASAQLRPIPVPEATGAHHPVTLLGVDGRHLVFYSQPASVLRIAAP